MDHTDVYPYGPCSATDDSWDGFIYIYIDGGYDLFPDGHY